MLSAKPYATVPIGFLTAPLAKHHLGLGGGQCHQILHIFIFSDLFGTKPTKSTNSDFFGMKLQKVNNNFHHRENYIENYLLHPDALQSKDQLKPLLYADDNDDNNDMIWKITIIK